MLTLSNSSFWQAIWLRFIYEPRTWSTCIFCPYLFSNYQLLIFFIEYLGRVRPTFKLSIGIISKLAKTWPLHCQMFQILNATDRPIVLWVKCNGDYNGRYNGMYRVVFLTGPPDFQYQNEKQVASNQD